MWLGKPLAASDVLIGSFEEAARAATGTAVIIDVFRAFTTAAICLARGTEKIVMVGALDEALALRTAGIGRRALGERHGDRPVGFDLGNSPAEAAAMLFDGETLIQTTSNGTRGVLAARGARRIYAGSFVTAGATARAILVAPRLPIFLVAMGDAGPVRRDEDELCALYLRALLCGRVPDAGTIAPLLRSMSDIWDTRHLSDEDVEPCLDIDGIPFAIGVVEEDGLMIAKPETVAPE